MNRYWLRDIHGRVLGPTTFDIARSLLASGRLRDVAGVSMDGVLYMPLSDVPEFANAIPKSPPAGEGAKQAAEIRAKLAGFKGKPAHEVFGVPAGSSAAELRAAFLKIVKDYHPARLPPTAPPELRGACVEAFQFLGAIMAEVDKNPPAAAPRPAPPKVASPAAAPTYAPEEFIGFDRRDEDRIEVRLRVKLSQVGIFTDHPMINLSRGGFFVKHDDPPGLGIPLDLKISLEEPPREILAKGRVTWMSARGGRSVPGCGIAFTQISKDDQKALEEFVKMGLAARARK